MAQAMLITGTDRRRRWSEEEKLEILIEAFAPGASPINVARRREISTGLLYTWRRKAMAQADQVAVQDSEPAFLPAMVAEPEAPRPVSEPAPARACDKPAPIIEIQFKRGVKVRIEAGMPEALITATLKALR